jgi:hypothetical protein
MKFSQFIKSIHPITSIRALEKAAKVPPGTIHKHLTKAAGYKGGQYMPAKHVAAIIRALCQVHHVVEIDGWRITTYQDSPAFFAEMQIPHRKPEMVEVSKGNFEYKVPMYRVIQDPTYLYRFFEKEG